MKDLKYFCERFNWEKQLFIIYNGNWYCFKWTIPGLFFLYFSSFQYIQVCITFKFCRWLDSNADLWCQNQPLYQLCHNRCPIDTLAKVENEMLGQALWTFCFRKMIERSRKCSWRWSLLKTFQSFFHDVLYLLFFCLFLAASHFACGISLGRLNPP